MSDCVPADTGTNIAAMQPNQVSLANKDVFTVTQNQALFRDALNGSAFYNLQENIDNLSQNTALMTIVSITSVLDCSMCLNMNMKTCVSVRVCAWIRAVEQRQLTHSRSDVCLHHRSHLHAGKIIWALPVTCISAAL